MTLHAPTVTLLRCAAFGAIGALILIGVSPLTSAAAVLNPVLYATLAGVTMIMPMLARHWTGAPGATTMTAAIVAAVALPFTSLGPALFLAMIAPAGVVDLALWRRRRPTPIAAAAAAAAGGVMIWLISFAVISPDLVTTSLVVTLLVVRIASYIAAMLIAGLLADRIQRSGVRPGTATAPRRRGVS